MIDYLPMEYGELLFGYIYRYHIFSGNLSCSDTALDVWGDRSKWIYSPLFPAGIIQVLDELNIEPERYFTEHSILPFYDLFLDEKLIKHIKDETLYGKVTCVHKLFKDTPVKTSNTSIKYCPLCIKECRNLPLFKREHQIESVYVCTKHKCLLEIFEWSDRRKRLHFNYNTLNRTPHYEENQMLLSVAKDMEYILNSSLSIKFSDIYGKLYDYLDQRKSISSNMMWRQEITQRLKTRFQIIPSQYENMVDYLAYYNPLEGRKSKYINPAKYILLIDCIFGSFENFIHEL